jgi:(p)ppGpp synthase/HD superfamily hydrolase
MSVKDYYAQVLDAPKLVKVIKLCDRLDNILSLYTCPDASKVQRYIDFTTSHYPALGMDAHARLTRAILAEVERVRKHACGQI